MHKLIHSVVLGTAHEFLHETLGRIARPRQTTHLRIQPGYSQEAQDEDLRAALLPQHLHRQHRDTS